MDAAHADGGLPAPVVTALRAARGLGVEWVRWYHRLDVSRTSVTLDRPVMFVANHGFGGIFDVNVFAAYAAFEQLGLDRPVTAMTHQLAWTLKIGRLLEPLGSRPASPEAARTAVSSGHHLLVMPGGDLDAGKSFADRNRIVFGDRRGFARLAAELDVPIVPIVTAGAGESLLVISDGQRLARALRVDRLLRMKALPVSLSLPWGLSVGIVGLLPYLALPTKLHTRVLAPLAIAEGETTSEYGDRVHRSMQEVLTVMTASRTPILG